MKHPNHAKELPRLNRVIGQLNGIQRMIEEGRYCPDIIHQLKAARSGIASLEQQLFKDHLQHCVTRAFESGEEDEKQQKIAEILRILKSSI